MSSLHLPRPSVRYETTSLDPNEPPDDVSMSDPTHHFIHGAATTLQSRLAASARQQQIKTHARLKRAEAKSPFVPKRHQQAGGINASQKGKERDLTELGVAELKQMIGANESLLKSRSTMSLLPDSSDIRIRQHHERLEARLKELQDLNHLKDDLERTHLDERDDVKVKRDEPHLSPVASPVKIEPQESERELMSQVTDEDRKAFASSAVAMIHQTPTSTHGSSSYTSPSLLATSPTAKRRLALRAELSPSHNSLTGTISLSESLRLQEQAAARNKAEAERRAEQFRLRTQAKNKKVGAVLRGALQGHHQGAALGNFLSHIDSDDSDDDEDHDPLDDAEQELFGLQQGQLDDEEDQQLNPYRHAYTSGYQQAISDEAAASGREGGAGANGMHV